MRDKYFSDFDFFFLGQRKLLFEEDVLLFEILILLGEIIKFILELFKAYFHLMLNTNMFSDLLLGFLDCFLKDLVIFQINVALSVSDCRNDRFVDALFRIIINYLGHVVQTELIDL